jgi:thioredoxin reductase
MNEKRFDVIVVGGGPAGLSAALILGRMRREVLLLDTDAPANAVSSAMHGFLAQDGVPPAEVRRVAAEQLDPYGSVERRATAAVFARRAAEGFEVTLAGGDTVWGRRLLLAHGMRYGLPDLDGVEELWGKRVFHCPYCHGWEVRDQAIAVYASGEKAVHQALLLRALSEEVVLLSAGIDAGDEDRRHLARAGVRVIDDPVERLAPIEDGLRVEFAGERRDLERHALFIQPELSLASEIAPSLGAGLTETGAVHTDETGLTTVPGLYAAGDAGTEVQSVAVATGSGARAAYALNADLARGG